MKVAIYSRGLDFEQENPLLVLLEELVGLLYDGHDLLHIFLTLTAPE